VTKKKQASFETQVRVNQRFVDELIAQQSSSTKRNNKKGATNVEELMTDSRFTKMFEDEEFKRDPNAEAYKRLAQVSTDTNSSNRETFEAKCEMPLVPRALSVFPIQ